MRQWLQAFPHTWFGFTATVTRPMSLKAEEAVRAIHHSHLLLESDAPHLMPTVQRPPFQPPQTSQRQVNHPWLLGHVCQRVAEIRGTSADDVWKASTMAAIQLYYL